MTISIQPQATIPLGTGGGTAKTTIPAGQPAHPKLKMTVKKKLPNGVASNVKQHVLFLLDRSSSMSGAKIAELNMAMAAILSQLAEPENKDGFRVTIIPFNNAAHVEQRAVPASALPSISLSAGGGTNFDAPLKAAIQEIEDFKSQPNQDGWHFLQPQAVILSDGWASASDSNIQDLQELAHVTAVAYGGDADQAQLARIASDGQVHVVGTNGGALRDFLASVGATMTATIRAAT